MTLDQHWLLGSVRNTCGTNREPPILLRNRPAGGLGYMPAGVLIKLYCQTFLIIKETAVEKVFLERAQAAHNLAQSEGKNLTASNDFHQTQMDMGKVLSGMANRAHLDSPQYNNIGDRRRQMHEVENGMMRTYEQQNKTNTADLTILKEIKRRKGAR